MDCLHHVRPLDVASPMLHINPISLWCFSTSGRDKAFVSKSAVMSCWNVCSTDDLLGNGIA